MTNKVTSNVLPCIEKTTKKISGTGMIIEENRLFVQGENLKEVRKHFNELKNES